MTARTQCTNAHAAAFPIRSLRTVSRHWLQRLNTRRAADGRSCGVQTLALIGRANDDTIRPLVIMMRLANKTILSDGAGARYRRWPERRAGISLVLERIARQMTTNQYKTAIKQLGLSQVAASVWLGISPRQSWSYAIGEYPVPGTYRQTAPAVYQPGELDPESPLGTAPFMRRRAPMRACVAPWKASILSQRSFRVFPRQR